MKKNWKWFGRNDNNDIGWSQKTKSQLSRQYWHLLHLLSIGKERMECYAYFKKCKGNWYFDLLYGVQVKRLTMRLQIPITYFLHPKVFWIACDACISWLAWAEVTWPTRNAPCTCLMNPPRSRQVPLFILFCSNCKALPQKWSLYAGMASLVTWSLALTNTRYTWPTGSPWTS
jgi:hypothetical protein